MKTKEQTKEICQYCKNHIHRMCEYGKCTCPLRADNIKRIDWNEVGPELLEVCKEAVGSSIDGSFIAASKWFEKMKIAIAKVEGENQ